MSHNRTMIKYTLLISSSHPICITHKMFPFHFGDLGMLKKVPFEESSRWCHGTENLMIHHRKQLTYAHTMSIASKRLITSSLHFNKNSPSTNMEIY